MFMPAIADLRSYDPQGDITEKSYIDSDWRNVAFYTDYAYDQAGRLETVKTTTGNGSYTTEAVYDYFASGKPSRLALGSLPAATVTYNYKERDWVTNISASQYWEHLGYNVSSEIGGTPQFNGNISWETYYMAGLNYQDPYGLYLPTSTVGYSYLYDNLSRLTRGTFGFYADDGDGRILWRPPEGSYNMPTITYDNDGNINNLERNGSGTGAMDNLYYYYTSGTDRLTHIWNQVNNVTSTCSYDSNGNIISDDHSSIAYTLYDIYNEPVEVFMKNGTEYTYGYDVNGARIFKNPGGGSSYVFYANDPTGKTEAVHLEPYSSNVDYNIWANGDNIAQVRYTYYNSYARYYYLKDHLGDISMIVNQNGGVDSYNNYYPFGEQMAGSGMNQAGSADGRYKYNGKELDVETSCYAYGDRSYDPWAGLFHSVDPFADKYRWQSPYSYALDNPEVLIDINGDSVTISTMSIQGSIAGHGFATASSSATGVTNSGLSVPAGTVDKTQTNAIAILGFTSAAAENYVHNPLTTLGANGKLYFNWTHPNQVVRSAEAGEGLAMPLRVAGGVVSAIDAGLTLYDPHLSPAVKGILVGSDVVSNIGGIYGFAASQIMVAAVNHDMQAMQYQLTHTFVIGNTESDVTNVYVPFP